jgi:ABC-2 type transport system ATP-binding protein
MTPDAYKIKRDIGVIFQEVAVFEELTVYENIDYFCGLYVKDKQERKKDIEDAIALVGLDEFRKYYPKQLSGGLLRRLNIACGIAHKPKLIFLDEPTVAVDPQSRNNILDGIRKLRDDGATICYTTHYMEEVEILCDRIIILDRGKIIAQGTSDELKALAKIEEKVTIETKHFKPEFLEKLQAAPNVDKAEYAGHQLVITYKSGKNNVAKLIEKQDVDAEKVSSTVIRRLIERGEMNKAARMLSHPYLLAGDVDCAGHIASGEALKLLPPPGEYPVRIEGRPGVLRITAKGTPELLRTAGKMPSGHILIEF